MKKKLLVLVPTMLAMFLTACGGGGGKADPTPVPTPGPVVVYYTVTFANTTMESVQVESGKTIAKPADPKKANSIFAGWYLDADCTKEATFPLKVTSDTTLYALFYSYQEAFQKARANTIGDKVPGYEYDYTLTVSASYMGVALTGNTTGNAKYNANTTDVSFYDEHVNSGLLFLDGTKYQMKKGRELHEVTVDKNDVVKKYNIKSVGDDYKYDSSSFAKAVFEYDETKLKEINPTTTANEYELKTSFNVSSGVALIGNYVNHPMVEKIIGELPETSVATGMYVTFSGNKLNSYRYIMGIDVADVTFTLSYQLTFKNIGVAPTITPKVFNNTYVTNTDVANAKAEITGVLNAYKALEHSSYDFEVKTAVDYKKKNAINATIDGFTKRKVASDKIYYLNDYEVDTDHKNADLYKEKGLGDCHGARAMLSTGEVHDLKKKAVLSGYNDVATVEHTSADDYYLLDVLGMFETVTFIQKLTDSSKGTVTYAVGTNSEGAVDVLKAFNNTLRLNPIHECSVDVKAFGEFADSSVTIKTFEFSIVVANGALSEITLKMNGKLAASFPGSRDFETAQDAGFKLDYSLKVTDKGSDYEPAAEVKDVK